MFAKQKQKTKSSLTFAGCKIYCVSFPATLSLVFSVAQVPHYLFQFCTSVFCVLWCHFFIFFFSFLLFPFTPIQQTVCTYVVESSPSSSPIWGQFRCLEQAHTRRLRCTSTSTVCRKSIITGSTSSISSPVGHYRSNRFPTTDFTATHYFFLLLLFFRSPSFDLSAAANKNRSEKG